MSILAVLGVILIVLALLHVIPFVIGLVLGIVLILVGGWPLYGSHFRGRRY